MILVGVRVTNGAVEYSGEQVRAWPKALRPFRRREYRMLTGSMAMSLFASGLWLVAVVFQVMAWGGGPARLSVVATSSSIGVVLSALVGGVAADRMSRQRLLRIVELVRVVGAGLAGVLALAGWLQFWQLVIVAFALGAAEAFYFPAYSAMLPSLLHPDELLAANGVEGSLRPVAQQALGPAAAGALVAVFMPGAAFGVAALAYGLALVFLLFMKPEAPVAEGPGDDESVLRQLREGFTFLFRTGWLFATLAFSILYVTLLVGPLEVLLPFAVRDISASGGPKDYAFVLAAYGVGGVLGSVLMASWRLPRRYLTVMLLLWGGGAIPMALIGITDRVWVMAAVTFVDGVTNAAALVIWGTLLQRRVPTRLLGRVSSLDFFVSLALMPVSMALAGPVGESIGIRPTFILVGALPIVLALTAIVAWRLPRDEKAHPLSATTR